MKKFLLTVGLCLTLALTLAIPSAAKEAEEISLGEETAAFAAEEEAQNPFLLFYEELSAHLPELFSALSLLGACSIAFCYKKGLLPILRDGLGAIGNAAIDSGKKAEKYAEKSLEICEKANDSIHSVASYMQNIEQALLVLDEKFRSIEEQKSERNLLHELMRGQIDMLLEIFLASSLPQFEKDRVCRHVEKMKLALQADAPAEASDVQA